MSGTALKGKSSTSKREDTSYVIPFQTVLQSVGLSKDLPAEVKLSREQFENLVRSLLRGVHVDETWYRATYADVNNAIENGGYKSAQQHFIENGYFEGRRPSRVVVDEDWYSSVYPDVAEGIEFGEISSCQDHFDTHGEAEGRLPREY